MKLSIPNGVTRRVSMTVLKTQKHSPAILFAAGVIGVGATVVTACKATLKLDEVLEESKDKLEEIKGLQDERYSEKDRGRDTAVLYVQAAGKLTRLYGPALILGTLSIAALTGSHRILTSRNAALTAAYAALDKSFKQYRQRVVDSYGEDKEREIRYGVQTKDILVEDANGPKKKTVKIVGDGSRSMYARFFDDNNQNWDPNPEYNLAFLRLQQNWANDRLRARGHILLNDVFDLLGLDRTPAGSQVGWLWQKNTGDNVVDFGIWDDDTMESTIAFMSGREGGLWLDFNVDGVIWKDI